MNSALLVMDAQRGIIERFGSGTVIDSLVRAVGHARTASIPVIFVRVAFRPGFPEVSPANRTFSEIAARTPEAVTEGSALADLHPALERRPEEAIVVKRRVSAFSGSDLEVILRSQEISHLVLSGVATGGVVLSTVREAADRDYRLTVLADACADQDADVHRVLLERVFPRQADVISADEWQRSVAAERP